MSKTHYEVLGVNELAGDAKIKRHYYELCKKYHPDVAGGDPQKMVAINEAYRVLSDPTLKSGYDRELAATRREATFAQTAQQAKTQQAAQTAWQDIAFEQQEEEPTVFRRAAQTAKAKKKHTGMAWSVGVSGAFAMALIAISFLAPFPRAATAGTSTTPSVATTDSTNTTDQTNTSTGSQTADPNAQAALDTLQADTPSTTAPTGSTTSGTSSSSTSTSSTTPQTQSTHKHRHPISFWLPQTDN